MINEKDLTKDTKEEIALDADADAGSGLGVDDFEISDDTCSAEFGCTDEKDK